MVTFRGLLGIFCSFGAVSQGLFAGPLCLLQAANNSKMSPGYDKGN